MGDGQLLVLGGPYERAAFMVSYVMPEDDVEKETVEAFVRANKRATVLLTGDVRGKKEEQLIGEVKKVHRIELLQAVCTVQMPSRSHDIQIGRCPHARPPSFSCMVVVNKQPLLFVDGSKESECDSRLSQNYLWHLRRSRACCVVCHGV